MLVIGGGPNAIGVLQVLKLQGAKVIVIVGLMESRQFARAFGATHVLDPGEFDIRALIIGVARNSLLRDNCFHAILDFAFAETTGLFALMMAFLLLYIA